MTVAVTSIAKRHHLKGFDYIAFLVFSGNYTAAGDSVTAAQFGLQKIDMVTPQPIVMGATHGFFLSAVPTTPDQNGRFTAFTLNIADMLLSTGATADHAAGAYSADLTAHSPGLYCRVVGF